MILSLVFISTSIIKARQANYAFDFRTIVQTALVILPILYGFCIINIFSTNTIIKLMKFTLIVLICVYFTEKFHTIPQFLNIENWKDINIENSRSFTESSLCAESFLQLFLFFYYFNGALDENKKKKINVGIYQNIAFLFIILSFKRLGMLIAVLIITIGKVINLKGKINKKVPYLVAVMFCLLTVGYTLFMKGEIFTNLDVYNITTGRDYILNLWEEKGYMSYGFGTSMLIIGRYLEMDLIQIYLELGFIPLLIYSISNFSLIRKSLYSCIIITYAFLNMLTASSLPTTLPWAILMVTISCCSTEKCKDEKIEVEKKGIEIWKS